MSERVVGRDDELAVGRAFLATSEHRSAVLAVEGPAGMGKTTIWEALIEEAEERGFAVLACRPVETEATFTLAAVRDMLEYLPPDATAALPPPQREALFAVVSAADPTRPIAEHLVVLRPHALGQVQDQVSRHLVFAKHAGEDLDGCFEFFGNDAETSVVAWHIAKSVRLW